MKMWLPREAGKYDLNAEEKFLGDHYKILLRYAIEKFPELESWRYPKGECLSRKALNSAALSFEPPSCRSAF